MTVEHHFWRNVIISAIQSSFELIPGTNKLTKFTPTKKGHKQDNFIPKKDINTPKAHHF